MIYATSLSALILASIHLIFPRFEGSAFSVKFPWVPFTGGVAIGYVYLYLLPKLGDFTATIAAGSVGRWAFHDYRAYLYSLLGFAGYFLAEQYAHQRAASPKLRTIMLAGVFFMYNLPVGYTLPKFPLTENLALVVVTVALALHILGNDHQIRAAGAAMFDRYLRWLLAAAVLIGWSAGALLDLPKEMVVLSTAILAGGIIANVMFEEVPRKSAEQRTPFLLGILFFLAVAFAMRSLPKLLF